MEVLVFSAWQAPSDRPVLAGQAWHSILRLGLVPGGSGIKKTHGAVFGPGIYLAGKLEVARSFATASRGWKFSSHGGSVLVVAACQVVVHPTIKRIEPEGSDYWVCSQTDHVRVRHLLIYRSSGPAQLNYRGLIKFAIIFLLFILVCKGCQLIIKKS